MKQQFINSFRQKGEIVNDKFAIKFKKPPIAYKGMNKPGKWFELRLADKTGEITLKYWGRNEKETDELYNNVNKGDIVQVNGEIQEYPPNSRLFSISVDPSKGSIKKSTEAEYAPEDFVATTSKDPKAMLEELKGILLGVTGQHMKILINKYLLDSKLMGEFVKAPAAMEYHQNYVGGLLEHTLNVMKIVESMCEIHPELDRDLAVTGAFLHDIGKIKEFDISGGIIDVSHEGMMVGHITIGYEILSEKINEIEGFPKKLGLKLLHIILSHHGKPEYGAVKKPQLPEAVAIHHADESDAQVDLYLRLKREANTEDSWIWDKKIKGHIYLE